MCEIKNVKKKIKNGRYLPTVKNVFYEVLSKLEQ